MRIEACDECRFDGGQWDAADTSSTIRSLAARWEQVLGGLPPELAHVRPDATTWSIAEYTDHVANSLWSMRFAVELVRTSPGTELDTGAGAASLLTADQPTIDLGAALARLRTEGAALHELTGAIPAAEWEDAAIILDGEPWTIGWTLRHGVHDVTHHLGDIGRIRHRLGAGTPHQVGRVDQINTSDGGVPKLPAAEAAVGWRGLEGDRQHDRAHHGRPWQALCLWGTEVIDALRAEGHPLHAGAAGENLTISGLDWPSLRPGARLRIGDVTAELTAYAVPCKKNGRWFSDGVFDRVHHDRHPGWSRLYASVLDPGTVRVGDEVVVEPLSLR